MTQRKINHSDIGEFQLKSLIRAGHILFAGNRKLRIYGKLNCASGKRMLKDNRVFFATEAAALDAGYRACRKCMRETSRLTVKSPERSPLPRGNRIMKQ